VEQVLGEHAQSIAACLGQWAFFFVDFGCCGHVLTTIALQNRAYAVSQLSDLHQKLSKASSAVQNTKAQAPTMPVDEKVAAAGKGKEPERKKPEENQLAKSVKDR
jgi:hypothetical protein